MCACVRACVVPSRTWQCHTTSSSVLVDHGANRSSKMHAQSPSPAPQLLRPAAPSCHFMGPAANSPQTSLFQRAPAPSKQSSYRKSPSLSELTQLQQVFMPHYLTLTYPQSRFLQASAPQLPAQNSTLAAPGIPLLSPG